MKHGPELDELETATGLLWHCAAAHGIPNLRVGDGPGELVVDVTDEATSFDIVAFEDEVETRLGWRPSVVPSGAQPGPPLPRSRSHARSVSNLARSMQFTMQCSLPTMSLPMRSAMGSLHSLRGISTRI